MLDGMGALLGLLGAAIGAVWLAYTRGKGAGREAEKDRAARASNQSDRRMDDADLGIGATDGANRDWLRERGNK